MVDPVTFISTGQAIGAAIKGQPGYSLRNKFIRLAQKAAVKSGNYTIHPVTGSLVPLANGPDRQPASRPVATRTGIPDMGIQPHPGVPITAPPRLTGAIAGSPPPRANPWVSNAVAVTPRPGVQPVTPPPTTQQGGTMAAQDVANVISSLGSAYIQARYGAPAAPAAPTPAFWPQVLGGAAVGAAGALMGDGGDGLSLGLPFVDVISEPPINPKTGKPYTNAVYSPTRGWYLRRRGRRRLMTNRDFNDLLRIQTLKNTDNVKVALAKLGG